VSENRLDLFSEKKKKKKKKNKTPYLVKKALGILGNSIGLRVLNSVTHVVAYE
jgi:hypothetical protein